MNLKTRKEVCQLRSENPIEAQALQLATRRSYSARSSGLMPNDDQMVEFHKSEAEEFVSGVLRDVDILSPDKWSIAKLIACWMSGEITDEASADARD